MIAAQCVALVEAATGRPAHFLGAEARGEGYVCRDDEGRCYNVDLASNKVILYVGYPPRVKKVSP
jgi:hypothetical protein